MADNKASNLDSFDPFAGVATTDPVSRSSAEISKDVSGIKKQATNPIDSTSKDNAKGTETVKPENSALDEALNNFKSDTLGQMKEGYKNKTENLSGNDLKEITKAEDGKLKLDKDGVMGQLSDVLGYDIGNSEGMQGDAGDKLFDMFTAFTDPDGGALLSKNGNQLSFKDGWREGTTEGLIYSLAMAGYDIYQEVRDSALEDAFDASSLYSAAQNGMVEAYEPIFLKIQPRTKAESMMVEAIQYVIQNGDLFSLREMIRILGPTFFPQIKANYPTMCRDFLSNYYMDKKVYVHQHQELCEELDDYFTKIFGLDWYLTETRHGNAYNVSIGTTCSKDAVDLLSTVDRLAIVVALRETFEEGDAAASFFELFSETPKIELV